LILLIVLCFRGFADFAVMSSNLTAPTIFAKKPGFQAFRSVSDPGWYMGKITWIKKRLAIPGFSVKLIPSVSWLSGYTAW
jgi:hypothetical protein